MTLKEFLIDSFLEEKDVINELLMIDNSIQFTDTLYEDILLILRNSLEYDLFALDKCTVISDGNLEKTIKVLIKYSASIDNVFVSKSFLGIYTWFIKRIRNYYNSGITLDKTNYYNKYLSNDNTIVICGDSEFLDYMSKYFSECKSIIVDRL